MIELDLETLREVGLSPALAERFSRLAALAPELHPARVVEAQRDAFTVHDGRAERLARAPRRLVARLDAEASPLAVGDWVVVRDDDDGAAWIVDRLAPLTQIARRANDGRRQPLASNVDTALLVMGLDGDFNPRRMERTLAMVRASGVAPVIVLTKADVAPDARAHVATLSRRLPATVPVLAVDARSPQAASDLAPWLAPGLTLVLLGSSGAGKSTLVNTFADAAQATGGQRHGDGRGRHTTTARSMHRCPQGAWIIDTPGLRTWRPDADAATLAATFEDVQALAGRCAFRNCRHAAEPGCAVRGHVDPDRLESWRRLVRDAQRAERSVHERQADRRRWIAIGKAGRQRASDKRA